MTHHTHLSDKQIAILAADIYEDQELWYPYYRLKEAGADVTVIGSEAKEYTSKHGYPVTAGKAAREVDPSDFDGVIVPGGYAPDKLRRDPDILDFVREIDKAGKLVAAICHAGWVLISASILEGRNATCYHAIVDDVKNAGANYSDEAVVVDDNLVTSRSPADLPQWLPAIMDVLAEQKEPMTA